jgi:hypothetical protein
MKPREPCAVCPDQAIARMIRRDGTNDWLCLDHLADDAGEVERALQKLRSVKLMPPARVGALAAFVASGRQR